MHNISSSSWAINIPNKTQIVWTHNKNCSFFFSRSSYYCWFCVILLDWRKLYHFYELIFLHFNLFWGGVCCMQTRSRKSTRNWIEKLLLHVPPPRTSLWNLSFYERQNLPHPSGGTFRFELKLWNARTSWNDELVRISWSFVNEATKTKTRRCIHIDEKSIKQPHTSSNAHVLTSICHIHRSRTEECRKREQRKIDARKWKSRNQTKSGCEIKRNIQHHILNYFL